MKKKLLLIICLCLLPVTIDAADVFSVPNTRKVAGHALSADVTVAKADVGLGNVDNTSDVNKPVSTAQQTALNAKQAAYANLTGIGQLANSAGYLYNNGSGTFSYATPAAGVTGAANVGSGQGVYYQLSGSTLQFKSIAVANASDGNCYGGYYIGISVASNTLTITLYRCSGDNGGGGGG
jgi:hypothetical protein